MAILKYGMEWYVWHNMPDIPVRTDRTVRHRCCHLGLNVETSIHSERFTECLSKHLVRPKLVVWREGYGLASLITLSTTVLKCWYQATSYLDRSNSKYRTYTYLTCMYGMLYGTVWPYLQHENMVWYGSMASLVCTHCHFKVHHRGLMGIWVTVK